MTDIEMWTRIRNEILSIPHWYDKTTGKGGFDLEPLGPNESSETGAFKEVMAALNRAHPGVS